MCVGRKEAPINLVHSHHCHNSECIRYTLFLWPLKVSGDIKYEVQQVHLWQLIYSPQIMETFEDPPGCTISQSSHGHCATCNKQLFGSLLHRHKSIPADQYGDRRRFKLRDHLVTAPGVGTSTVFRKCIIQLLTWWNFMLFIHTF